MTRPNTIRPSKGGLIAVAIVCLVGTLGANIPSAAAYNKMPLTITNIPSGTTVWLQSYSSSVANSGSVQLRNGDMFDAYCWVNGYGPKNDPKWEYGTLTTGQAGYVQDIHTNTHWSGGDQGLISQGLLQCKDNGKDTPDISSAAPLTPSPAPPTPVIPPSPTPRVAYSSSDGSSSVTTDGAGARQPSPANISPTPSTLWGGYGIQNDTAPVYKSVTGTWSVPSIKCTDNGKSLTYGAVWTWVGIGGALTGDSHLQQAGVYAYCDNGSTHYEAFFEAYNTPGENNKEVSIYRDGNGNPVREKEHCFLSVLFCKGNEIMPVAPGDKLTATITMISNGTYKAEISESSWGKPFVVTFHSTGQPTAAEWIVEAAPDTKKLKSQVPLPDFGSVTFTDWRTDVGPILAGPDIIRYELSSLKPGSSIRDGAQGAQAPKKVEVGAFSQPGTDFTMDWLHS